MAPSASALSHAAPMSTVNHTNMELEESATDSTPVDSATAAAAAAMSDLSDLPSPAVDGQLQRRG